MTRSILKFALLFCSAPVFALHLTGPQSYYPESFYTAVDQGLAEEDLKRQLFTVLSSAHIPHPGAHDSLAKVCADNSDCYQHFSLGYTRARQILFGELHLEERGGQYAIRDVYCQHLSIADDYVKDPPAPGRIPDPKVLNTEHTWPQSRFSSRFDKNLQKSDLHILFPALANANTSRSNHEFNEITAELDSPCPQQSRRGHSAGGGGQIFFEPPLVHKGNVACAIFYFSVRYQLAVSAQQETSLKAWHHQDPPDEFERRRNDAIFAKQKVRNPFIDHPELVNLISDF